MGGGGAALQHPTPHPRINFQQSKKINRPLFIFSRVLRMANGTYGESILVYGKRALFKSVEQQSSCLAHNI